MSTNNCRSLSKENYRHADHTWHERWVWLLHFSETKVKTVLKLCRHIILLNYKPHDLNKSEKKQSSLDNTRPLKFCIPPPFSWSSDTRLKVFTVMKVHAVVFWVATPCSHVVGYHFSLKMEPARSSEKLVIYHISTRRHHPEEGDMT
jgi:hypothetical protein